MDGIGWRWEGREGDIKTFDDHEGINLFLLWRRRRTMIVFLKRSSSFARTFLFLCVREGGLQGACSPSLSHTH